MASFFNLILDTLAPSGVTLSINNKAQYTTTQEVTTNMEFDIDKITYQRSIINKCTNRNVKIITEINEQMKIDVRTNSDVIIETKTNIVERNIK